MQPNATTSSNPGCTIWMKQMPGCTIWMIPAAKYGTCSPAGEHRDIHLLNGAVKYLPSYYLSLSKVQREYHCSHYGAIHIAGNAGPSQAYASR